MRDMRLSFWSSVYGCISIVCILSSRVLSDWLADNPVRDVCFLDPLNYILVFSSILFLLRATSLASASIKKLRTGKNLLIIIQTVLFFDLLYQLVAQVLHFTLDVNIHNSLIVVALTIPFSLPCVCGLYALYFSKQLRSNIQYCALGMFIVSIFWCILRLTDKVIIPLIERLTMPNESFMAVLKAFAGINDELSFVMFAAALVGLIVYAYYSGSAAKKMPEKQE